MSDTREGIVRVLDLVAADDFLQVRPALIRELDGSANTAVLFTLIQWRTSGQYGPHYEKDGHRWWRATLDELSDESGMKKESIRYSLKPLLRRGLVIAETHKLQGSWDKTLSYRLVTTSDLPDPVGISPHRSGNIPISHVGISPHLPYRDKETHHSHHIDVVEAVDNSTVDDQLDEVKTPPPPAAGGGGRPQISDHQHHTDDVGDDDESGGRSNRFRLTAKREQMLRDVMVATGQAYAFPAWSEYIQTLDWRTGEAFMRRWIGVRSAMANGESNRREDLDALLAEAGIAPVSDAEWQKILGANSPVNIEF